MKNAVLNLLLCFCIALVIAPFLIKWLRKLKFGQSILIYVEKHKAKSGTPTMGGLIFIISSLIGFLVFWNKNNLFATISIMSLLFFGIIGFFDDFIKIKFKQNEGLKPYQKIIAQLGLAIVVGIFAYQSNLVGTFLYVPFTNKLVDIGFWIIPFVVIFYLAVVNSVNLIDGLDGLCGGVSSVVILIISIIIYILTNSFSGVYLDELNNLVVVAFGVVGGLLAFLLFNAFPAKIFMGDTGSLAIGGFIASVFVFSKNYLMLPIIGVAYFITAISVIIQVVVFKITKKRVFKMAPLHHHFEQDYHEVKVVNCYVILTIIIGLLSIIMYL